MPNLSVPDGPFVLRKARVPAALLVERHAERPDEDGLSRRDIAVADGLIRWIAPPSGPPAPEDIDCDEGQVWPCFVDVHAHLDKGHIWPRARNRDGTHATAARTVAADRARAWSRHDIARRFDFGLRCAFAHGTSAIRTHLDSYDFAQAETAWSVFAEMEHEWRGRVRLQGVCMTRLDTYDGLAGLGLVARVAENNGVLGGILKFGTSAGTPSAERIDAGLARLFALAREHGLDVDLHIDETGDPEARTLAQVARAVLASRFRGTVTCGHCCSLATQDQTVARQTIALVAEAGLHIVSLPMVNLYLQGRNEGETPRWRGITRVHELARAGVRVAVAGDNNRDPFFAHGDHDMLEVFREFVRIAHAEAPDWSRAATRTPADIMRLSDHGRLRAGAPADLVLFRARTASELLSRPWSDRIVLRAGRPIATTPPDYRELDDLFAERSNDP
jgi:cytosine deaminase